jgi:protocatechuate 3,4-dioxygenase beta subunit
MSTLRCALAKTAAFALAVLTGHVTDATTGQPLPNVSIAIGSHRSITDAHGAYRLTGLTPGRYTLTARSDDVPPQDRDVVVKQNAQTTLDLVLCSTTLDYGCGGGSGPG